MNNKLKNILLFVGIPLILIISIIAVSAGRQTPQQKKDSDIVQMVLNNEISEYSLNWHTGELIYTQRSDNKQYRYVLDVPQVFFEQVDEFVQQNNKENAGNPDKFIKYDHNKNGAESSWLLELLPSVILFILMIVVFGFFFRRIGQGMGGDKIQ